MAATTRKSSTDRGGRSAAGKSKSAVALRERASTMHWSRSADGGIQCTVGTNLGYGFEINDGDRTRRTYQVTPSGADRHLQPMLLSRVREISRAHDRNSCLLHGILDRWVDNTVSSGFGLRPNTKDPGWNEAARESMKETLGPSVDRRGMLDMTGFARLGLRALGTDGDFLLAHGSDGTVQAIEAHQIGTPMDRIGLGCANGVEVDAAGKPKGFWVHDQTYGGYIQLPSSQTRYVDAADCEFVPYRTRFTQTRGIPVVAAGLSHFDRLDEYIDNESMAAAIDACLTFFVQRQALDLSLLTPDKIEAMARDGTARILQKVEPGMILQGTPGDELTSLGGKRPGMQFEPYVITSLRMLGCSIGMPLELVLLDFSKSNFSSGRLAMLQAYRMFEVWQAFLRDRVYLPIYRRQILRAIAKRQLTLRDDAFRVRVFPPKWAWINPLQEIQALDLAIRAGVETVTNELERRGTTRSEYVETRAEELKEMREAGIPTTGSATAAVATPGEAAPANNVATLPGAPLNGPKTGPVRPKPDGGDEDEEKESDDDPADGGEDEKE
jgi:lambda family phage portal protein